MTRRRPQVALALGGLALIAALAPSPRSPDEAGDLRKLAEAKAEIGKKIADFLADFRLAPGAGFIQGHGLNMLNEQVEDWNRRVVDARLDAASGKDERVVILTDDVRRSKAIEARIKQLADQEGGPAKIDGFKAEFYRLDAEYRLAKEKAGR